jgi:hypothetical protein
MRRNRKSPEMAISEHELNSMTAELDMLHNETFPALGKTLDDFSANLAELTRKQAGRRTFLLGLGGAAAVGTLAACSSSKSGSKTSSSKPAAGATYTGDLKVVALAAALENLAVTAYQGALTMAGKGQLGTVPPAVATFVTTAMAQHKDHAKAWNSVLTKAGKPAISGAPLSITSDQVAMLNAAKSVPDVAKLALNLENVAAQTYTFATANVSDSGGIITAATIQPVEAMHAAILNFVLGQYPVPVSFIGVDGSLKPEMLTA